MLNKKLKTVIGLMFAMMLSISVLSGCTKENDNDTNTAKLKDGGTLVLKVNPEIAVSYDNEGKVTKLDGKNEDGKRIIEQLQDYVGKDAKTVVSELVTKIGDRGYFVEDVNGDIKKITLEIEKGSATPYNAFFDDVVGDVKKTVTDNKWYSPIDVVSEQGYGYTDYKDTDYGENNDGITDYVDTDYGAEADGVTDYNDTDYGYENDGVTDYTDTNYDDDTNDTTNYEEPNAITDYNDANDDGLTNYNDNTNYQDQNNTVVDATNYQDTNAQSNYGTNYGEESYNN